MRKQKRVKNKEQKYSEEFLANRFTREDGQYVKKSDIKKELKRIEQENNGILTPLMVVQAARAEDSILHPLFDWNDTVAANKHRLFQARSVINTISVTFVGKKTDAYFSANVIINNEPIKAYFSAEKVFSDEELKRQVLETALQELKYWERKYKQLSELVKVIDQEAVKEVEKRLTR